MSEMLGKFSRSTTRNSPEWNKTYLAEERLKGSKFFEEKGLLRKEKFFGGRPIIGRDRPINAGVYLGGSTREAIVVDDTKDPVLDRIYQELIKRRKQVEKSGKHFKDGLLEEVWSLVNEVMPYDESNVQKIAAELPRPDTKIYLGEYVGGGICRHQSLLTAYLLERLVKEKVLNGRPSVDRNYVPSKGGHAWVRYTNSRGVVYILDSAQGYIGALNDMTDKQERWFYERPEDTKPVLKKLLEVKRQLLRK